MSKGFKYVTEIGGDAVKGGSKAKNLYKAEGLLKMDLQKFAKGESNLIKYSKLDIGDGNPKNLIRWFKEKGVNFQVKSGHGYNRVHATGGVQHIGSMDELESAIVNNITKMIKNGDNLSKVNTYKINVNGYDLFYRAIKTGDGVIRVPTYFTR